MSWQDDARENAYVQAALNSNNNAELARNMRAADKAVDMVDGALNSVGDAVKGIFSSPEPPPKSSGGSLGGLLALGALAGGAYLLGKVFGGSDDKSKSTDSFNKNSSSKSSEYPETEW